MSKNWHTIWGSMASNITLLALTAENHTQQLSVKSSINGAGLRLHLSNQYNTEKMIFSTIKVQVAGKEQTMEEAVTLKGQAEICLEAGETVYSDELSLSVKAGDIIRVSTEIKQEMNIFEAVICHDSGLAKVAAHGEMRSALVPGPMQMPEEMKDFKYLYGVDRIETKEEGIKEIAFFGDSITQMGFWSEPLSVLLNEAYPGKVSTYNCGIAGNRVLHDSPEVAAGMFGEAAITRFEKSVFGERQPAVVIVQIGINDLCHPYVYGLSDQIVDSASLVEGLTSLADTAHRHQAKIICTTLLPYKGYETWNQEMEDVRQQVNDWIRNNEAFDDYFDFAEILRDEADHEKMPNGTHRGDWLHPNAQGGMTLAQNIEKEKITKFI